VTARGRPFSMRPIKKPKSPLGEQKKPRNPGDVLDTIRQAAGVCGIPYEVLVAAKHGGCPGFRHGRVHLSEVLPWMDEHGGELKAATGGDDSLGEAKRRVEWEKYYRARDLNAIARGTLVEVSVVNAALATACSEWNSARVHLEAEGPARMAGKEADECRVAVRAFTDEVGAVLHRALGKFNTQPKDTL